jgi:hypothetical protein
MPEDLQTEDIDGVELVSVGTHNASTGRVSLTRAVLSSIVDAFAKTKDALRVPLKIGHDDKQKLAGSPAVGWIDNVRLAGDKLIADVKSIPTRVAALMRAGAWRTRSVEIRHDYEVTGKGKFDAVLTGVALLGSELPAVKGLKDVFDLYSDDMVVAFVGEDSEDTVRLLFADVDANADLFEAFDALEDKLAPHVSGRSGVRDLRSIMRTARRQLRALLQRQKQKLSDRVDLVAVPTHDPPVLVEASWDGDAAMSELRAWASSDGSGDPDTIDFKKYAQGFSIIEGPEDALTSYKFPHHRVVDGRLRTSTAGVIAAFGAASGGRSGQRDEGALAHLGHHREALEPTEETQEMDLKTIATRIGLAEDATEEQVLAKLDEMKNPPKGDEKLSEEIKTELAEAQSTIASMQAEREKDKREEIVDKAIREGRYLPAQRADILSAFADISTDKVEKIVANAPKHVPLGERGSEQDQEPDELAEFEPTEDELAIAGSYGNSREDLIRAKAALAGKTVVIPDKKKED